MGGPLVDSSAEGVSSSLCLCHSTYEKSGFEHSSCACSEDENFEAGIAGGKDDLVVEEIGMALAEVMHVYDHNDCDDEGTDPGEDSDENGDSLVSLESHSTDYVKKKHSTDDLVDIDNEMVTSPALPTGNASESSIGKSDDRNSSTNDTPMLVSAMKGSRAKQGIITRLSVSWDPDVYDPPVTSESHTMRAHQRSSRKGHYKYKSSKSSSSRSSNGSKKDKKHSRHISSSSSSSSKRDRKPSYRSTNGGSSSSSRIDASDPQYPKVYGGSSSSITASSIPQYCKVSPSVPAESASLAEAVPVLKTMEQIKRSTSCCKEQPLSMLSRQFVAARYKGMFSFWGQNQLAS